MYLWGLFRDVSGICEITDPVFHGHWDLNRITFDYECGRVKIPLAAVTLVRTAVHGKERAITNDMLQNHVTYG